MCPKCKSRRVGHLSTRYSEGDKGRFVPMFVGLDSETWKAMGVIEAFVCAECGLLETYVRDPEGVPFEALEGFRWMNEDTDRGPFR
jgi:hypothetical protein